jgi:hypothetical protein
MKSIYAFSLSLALAIAVLAGCGERLSKANPLAPDPPAGFTVPQPTPTPFPACGGCTMLENFNAGTGVAYPGNDNDDGCGSSTSFASVAIAPAASHDGSDAASYNFQVAANAGCGYQYATLGFGSSSLAGITYLRFWVKGAVGGEDFNIKLRNPSGAPPANSHSHFLRLSSLKPVTTAWQEIRVPLSAFPAGLDFTLPTTLDFIEINPSGNETVLVDDVQWEP